MINITISRKLYRLVANLIVARIEDLQQGIVYNEENAGVEEVIAGYKRDLEVWKSLLAIMDDEYE